MKEDIGKLVLRLTIGGLLLLHGIGKLRGGIGWLDGMLDAKGLPTFLKYGVYLGEVAAPVLVILGLLTRIGGFLIFVNMLIAIFLTEMGHLTMLNEGHGWAPELPALYMLGGLAIFFLGGGKYSVGGKLA